jgi:phosphoglycerate dehydrogenase-like enzyme
VVGSRQLAHTRFPPSLRWLALSQSGAGHISAWLREEGRPPSSLAVTNVSGMHARWIGEFALGFMLSHSMRLPQLMQQQREEVWAMRRTGRVRGSVVLIVGMGAIGEEVARMCRAHGATVLATRRSLLPTVSPADHRRVDRDWPQALSSDDLPWYEVCLTQCVPSRRAGCSRMPPRASVMSCTPPQISWRCCLAPILSCCAPRVRTRPRR